MKSSLRSLVLLAALAATVPAIAQTEWVAPQKIPVQNLQAPFLDRSIDEVDQVVVHEGDAGYWVVLGSLSIEADKSLWEKSGRAVQANARRCGIDPFDDYSDKFDGFVPGYDVFVVGPFTTKGAALAVRDDARECIPDAYVKYGDYGA